MARTAIGPRTGLNTLRIEQPQSSLPSEASAMLLRVGAMFVIAGLTLALVLGGFLAVIGGVLIAGGGMALAIAMESVLAEESVDVERNGLPRRSPPGGRA
jgi:hypothetical protein